MVLVEAGFPNVGDIVESIREFKNDGIDLVRVQLHNMPLPELYNDGNAYKYVGYHGTSVPNLVSILRDKAMKRLSYSDGGSQLLLAKAALAPKPPERRRIIAASASSSFGQEHGIMVELENWSPHFHKTLHQGGHEDEYAHSMQGYVTNKPAGRRWTLVPEQCLIKAIVLLKDKFATEDIAGILALAREQID